MASRRYRVKCRVCDKQEDHIGPQRFSGLKREGWTDFESVQSYNDAISLSTPKGVGVWWTHVGICPECVAKMQGDQDNGEQKQGDDGPSLGEYVDALVHDNLDVMIAHDKAITALGERIDVLTARINKM